MSQPRPGQARYGGQPQGEDGGGDVVAVEDVVEGPARVHQIAHHRDERQQVQRRAQAHDPASAGAAVGPVSEHLLHRSVHVGRELVAGHQGLEVLPAQHPVGPVLAAPGPTRLALAAPRGAVDGG